MKRAITLYLLASLFSLLSLKSTNAQETSEYLQIIETFANTLLENGLDNYGNKNTKMWASVIDTRDLKPPLKDVPATQGVRDHDRAVGGSNFYHDVKTIQVFQALSKVKGDAKYSQAVTDYATDFLNLCQSPETGLLGWGEHLYYDFLLEEVTISPSKRFDENYGLYHEFEAATPPFALLWEIDSEKTKKAIEGNQYHFASCLPGSYLYSRHAYWDEAKYPTSIMPWIKHAGLYSFAYSFLYAKNQDELIRQDLNGIATLFWNQRNRTTNLTQSCIFHQSQGSGKTASPSGMGQLAYWMYKAWQQNPQLEELKTRSLTFWTAVNSYAWDQSASNYFSSLNLDGTPTQQLNARNPQQRTKYVTVYNAGYGSSSICDYGRMAAYMYKAEKDEQFKEIVKRTATLANSTPFPEIATAENYAQAINLNMDAYEVLGDEGYLEKARELANKAIKDLYRNGLFTRQSGDPYYEAKLGTGSMVAGIMRLYLHLSDNQKVLDEIDWSI